MILIMCNLEIKELFTLFNQTFFYYSAWHIKATCKKVLRPNLGQKFQHKSKEFFEFGLGDVGLGLWSGVAPTPSGGPMHRHAQAHTTSSSPTSNSQIIVATMGRLNKRK
jgi:hypothetical protein